jgi:hypothetical protein
MEAILYFWENSGGGSSSSSSGYHGKVKSTPRFGLVGSLTKISENKALLQEGVV